MIDDEKLEPQSIDELLTGISNPVSRFLVLWELLDYTDNNNPYFYVLSYDQWSAFVDKYVRVPPDIPES